MHERDKYTEHKISDIEPKEGLKPKSDKYTDYLDVNDYESEVDINLPNEKHPKKKSNFNVLKNHVATIFSRVAIVAAIGLAVSGLIWLFTPKEYDGIIDNKTWSREVIIEEYRTVNESAWDMIPPGGRLLYTNEEIRYYDEVISHYETKSRQVPEQILDGYDTDIYYTDNGNGTFTEHTSQTPRYRTEYRTEYYEEAVYKDVPVYDTKYYYEIERWKYDRTEKSSGMDDIPYWPTYKLDSNERVESKSEDYNLVIYVDEKEKYYTYHCMDEKMWNSYLLNQEVHISVSAGIILEMK